MLTVHQMLLKNRFLTGIGSGYDKILSQTRPKPNTTLCFAGNFQCVDCCCENYQRKTVTATETQILNFSSTKPEVSLVLFAQGFDSIRPNYEIETAKSDNFMEIFTC
jgi:hypothetical protein